MDAPGPGRRFLLVPATGFTTARCAFGADLGYPDSPQVGYSVVSSCPRKSWKSLSSGPASVEITGPISLTASS